MNPQEVRTLFKNKYQNEVVRHTKTRMKLGAIIIAQAILIVFALLSQMRLLKTIKEDTTLLNEANEALKKAQETGYMVWQMDDSCFAQLKSANMIQLVIKE